MDAHGVTHFLLVVFDGLRPDMVRADTTPNLLRFAAMGTRFAHARSVFPSETRVCSSTVVTGCLPRRHGLVANHIADPRDPARSIDTGDVAALRALAEHERLLDVPTLGELLAGAGRDLVVLSSGTTGQTYMLNPMADALGQVTVSAHGPVGCSAAGRKLLEAVDPPPTGPVERAVWIAELFRTRFLPAPPVATILWLCEPDTSGHYQGLFSEAQCAALRQADAAFGRILDDWDPAALTIAVASDHGHAGISGLFDVGAALAELNGFAGCTLLRGSSCGLFVPDAHADHIAGLATWLIRQDWVGSVFAADLAELPHGVLPRSALLADHRRAAHVLFTLRSRDGTTLYDGNLPVGGGTHGGLLGEELRIVLMLAGAGIAAGVSAIPAGLVDIAPTALALLGLGGWQTMDGRVLSEAFAGGAAPTDSIVPETWEAAEAGYAQRLSRTRLGRHVYLEEGIRL
jgi:arylsulfatase A-like enzyme